MESVKLISFLFSFFCITNCGGTSSVPSLTKEAYRESLENPSQDQENLKTGSFQGCTYEPAEDPIQKFLTGGQRTGETCSVTVNENNNVDVSFLNDPVSVVKIEGTDTSMGEFGDSQVLIVQDHEGEVVSVTHTIYDQKGVVFYRSFGQQDEDKEEDVIRECLIQSIDCSK